MLPSTFELTRVLRGVHPQDFAIAESVVSGQEAIHANFLSSCMTFLIDIFCKLFAPPKGQEERGKKTLRTS
ncbi:hypothetical protein HQ45_01020 [Porphyromonas crevioricanis]|uniref:Uncharacterized protein n=1 Tax=Porphyromonas crevioricanis TaxID=393921 RepID=A0AB34PEN2_9PORP|nr:hypothetical protein HQ45_01020 [Porphyromonas crevioricanis]KGN94012.1 hypothetical protein HQ38_07385 [Porphyromonas crevioricanis]